MTETAAEPQTYEGLRGSLERLTVPEDDDRQVLWVEEDLGVARTRHGAWEIFLVGPRLTPRTSVVRRHIEHDEWLGLGDEALQASRLVLPSAPHFLSIAALIATEMLRAGLGSRPMQDVLDDAEAIIELALRRGALAEELIVGLLGELLVLEQALLAVQGHPELRAAVLDMWQGYEAGRRDFVLGHMAIEVKTTRQSTSSHQISGLGQVEPLTCEDGVRESLYLLSVGLAETQVDGHRLPDAVERLLLLLTEPALAPDVQTPLQRRLLDQVERYGANPRGYRHETMAGWGVYQDEYRLTFPPRLYDMQDEDIKVLRRADLEGTFVSPEEIHFRLDLPARVNEHNPALNWQLEVVRITREALGLGE